jgi:hypothetical protein
VTREGTPKAGAPVAQDQTTTARSPRLGEWMIAAFMLGLFTVGYLAAQDWPFRAALFPKMIASLGVLLSVLRLLGLALETVRGRRAAPPVAPAPAAAVSTRVATDRTSPPAVHVDEQDDALPRVALVDDEAEEDSSMEYAFASAGGRAWGAALLWIVAFFVAFFVLGVFVAVPLFALVYLRVAGEAPWLGAVLYAIVTGAFIYLLFRQVLFLPLPTGVIPFLQF